jgi:zinc protease
MFFVILMLGCLWGTKPALSQTEIQEVISPKGIKAWFIREPRLKIVSMTFSFRGGAAYEHPQQRGISSLLTAMLMEGTEKRTAAELKNHLLENAIEISFTNTVDRLVGSLRTTLDHLPENIALLREILYTPRFAKEDLERVKPILKASIENQLKHPETQADLAHRRAIMGDHPYTYFIGGDPKTLMALSADNLRAYLKMHLTRDSLIIGVCGNVSEQELGLLLDELFGDLPMESTVPPLSVPQAKLTARTENIAMSNPQTIVLFSHPGLAHSHPDFMKLYLLNHIVGGGVTSRLWKEIREKRGLAYEVGTDLTTYEKIKLLSGELGSDDSKVAEAIALVKQVWQDIRAHGVTETELQDAKTYLIGVFPLMFSSTIDIAAALHTYQVFGLTRDYFRNRTAIIQQVSLAAINQFAQTFIDPQQLVFTVVGNVSPQQQSSNAPLQQSSNASETKEQH